MMADRWDCTYRKINIHTITDIMSGEQKGDGKYGIDICAEAIGIDERDRVDGLKPARWGKEKRLYKRLGKASSA